MLKRVTKKHVEELTNIIINEGYWCEEVKEYLGRFEYSAMERLNERAKANVRSIVSDSEAQKEVEEVETTPETIEEVKEVTAVEEVQEGTQFITLNGDYQLVTVLGSIDTKNGKRYTVSESNEIFTKEYILDQLSRNDILTAKLERQKERNKQIEAERLAEVEADKKAQQDYNFCYGYIDNVSALQGGRILKALNKKMYYNNSLITRKDLIHFHIGNNSKTEIHTDKSGKKTKRFYTNSGSFFEVTKIEYDYVNYLIDNQLFGISE